MKPLSTEAARIALGLTVIIIAATVAGYFLGPRIFALAVPLAIAWATDRSASF